MTRFNCDRCGKEIQARDYKKPHLGTLKWSSDFYLHPTIDAWDLCQPCMDWIIKEATIYERSTK